MQQITQAYLIIQLGNRWTDIIRLQPGSPILVGRSSECQVVVKDERVSRNHARFIESEDGWAVEDLGSRNGTQVGEKIVKSEVLVLSEGDVIVVGGCKMTFSKKLQGVFKKPELQAAGENQQTQEVPPTILNRLENSQWSNDAITAPSFAPTHSEETWSFFYRLVFDLVTCRSADEAASIALERLLSKLELSCGGVIAIESAEDGKEQYSVLATRQPANGAYHRISDFLLATVQQEKQAVLARNVKDDSKLSVARASGQREVISSICAPIRKSSSQVDTPEGERTTLVDIHGVIHIYSAGTERMLTDADLELVVGVADNLGIALSRQDENAALVQTLETTQRRIDQLQRELEQGYVMVGQSKPIQAVKQSISRAGPTNATVLVRGESGVGKELVARGIHAASKRKDGPLVCLNCAALAPTLLESELFGHEKGSFTGATERKIGKFEAADGGTLLLDEIGEMSPELQAKFLRVLEGQPFERLGGNKPIKTDVRVIAATNRALEEAVEAKEFRADLYYRLRVIELIVPPLRERLDDIPILVDHFLNQMRQHAGRQLTGMSPAGLELLTRHSWPGNVRELRNVIERAVVLGAGASIEPEDLNLAPLGLSEEAQSTSNQPQDVFEPLPLAELEKRHIYAMLDYASGNKTKASQLLGIERSTLDRKLKRYNQQ